MNRNMEIKARVGDLESLRARVEAIADSGPVIIHQVDTFFNCRHGRLKLREERGENGQLIFYVRPDSREPAESLYSLTEVPDSLGLLQVLSKAMGVKIVVNKVRTLYRIGRTRVHLDQVEGLGTFMELEVVLGPDESLSEGTDIARDLMDRLGIGGEDLVEAAYADLLQDHTG
jgi:adenylate cyclase